MVRELLGMCDFGGMSIVLLEGDVSVMILRADNV